MISFKTAERFFEQQPFFNRLLLSPLFLLLFIARAFYFAHVVLFHPPQHSFTAFYAVTKRGYNRSYSSHTTYVKQLQVGSAAIFVVIILASSLAGWWSSSQPVYSATCNISNDTTLNQSYIDSNSCTDVNVTGTATITFTEAINLGGAADYTLTVNEGVTATFSGSVTLSDTGDVLTVNGTLQHAAEDTTGVNITAQTLTIASTGSINLNSKGCGGGPNSGTNAEGPNSSTGVCETGATGYGDSGTTGAGGSHGGRGGRGNDVFTGTSYGNSLAPTFLGSGGGGSSTTAGASGGGKVRLDIAGILTVSGSVIANGGTGSGSFGSGGGSGGSVHITAGTVAGSGTISANGGNGFDGASGDSGGGSGGRIAMYYNTNSSFILSNITATKGFKGGVQTSAADGTNGTAFALNRKTDDGGGDLVITSGLDFRSEGDYTRANITVYNGAAIVCATGVTSLTLGATSILDFQGVTWICNNLDSLNLSAGTWTTSNTNTMSLSNAGVDVDWDISNNLTLNNMTITGGSGGNSTDGGSWTLDNPIDVSLVGTTLKANLNWTGLTSLSLDASSAINVNSLGCNGGSSAAVNGAGPDTSTGVCAATISGYGDSGTTGAGGSHGGAGGRGNDSFTGTTYGSNTAPVLLGSGGGGSSTTFGGIGGGKIRLDTTGTLTINGAISANGATGSGSFGSGGGSGGSIYITTRTLAGTGTIDADAGNGFDGLSGDSGGGGGGRIAIYYVTDSNSLAANLGTSNVALGTKGGTQNSAADGANGSTYTLQYTVPSTPSISSPSSGATDQGRNLSVTASTYSSNGATHTSSDWQMSDDNTFSNDCSDTNLVFCKLASTSNKDSITISSSNGTFQNALASRTKLAPATTYYLRTRYTNLAGNSSWSSVVTFTTLANVVPSTPTNSAPSSGTTNQSVNPTLSASSFSDSDSDAHLNTDWLLYESSTCDGTANWSKTGETSNLTSILVSSSNGTFADALSGQTRLKAHTTYSFKARYLDTYSGTSSYSSCTSFTTTNTSPSLDSNISTQTLTEDTNVTGAFDLDTYFSDTDFNDNDQYTCSASDGLTSSLGTMTINSNRTVDFALTTNANGSDTIQFSCQDGGGSSATSNSITLTVNSVNDAPSFTKGADVSVLEDAGVQTLSTWASSLSTGASNESDQTLSFSVTPASTSLFSTQPAISSSGTLTFTPNTNANGNTTVTVYAQDNGGTNNNGSNTSTSQTFTISITAVNDAPSFTKGADQSIAEDAGAQSVTGWAISISPGPSDESSQSVSFSATAADTSFFSTQPAVSSSGVLTYTPAANTSGTTTVQVKAQDTGGTANSGSDTSSAQTLRVTIGNINDAPSFTVGSNQVVDEDSGAQTVDNWATNISPGDSGESNQAVSFEVSNNNNALFSTQPAVSGSGTLTYTPADNQSGLVVVTLNAQDDGGTDNGGSDTSASQSFTITVVAVNDQPQFTGLLPSVTLFTKKTAQQVLDLDDYFSDLEDDELSFETKSPGPLDVTIQTGQVTVTAGDSADIETIYFTATDTDQGTTQSGNMIISVLEAYPDFSSDLAYVVGQTSGPGKIQVFDQDHQVSQHWQAFSEGGVIPRLGVVDGEWYVYATKYRSGSTMKIFKPNGKLIKKKLFSSALKWRRWSVGELDGNNTTGDIVVSSKQSSTVSLKIFAFSPSEQTIQKIQQRNYSPVSKSAYWVFIKNNAVHLLNSKGKTILQWKPFDL